MYFSNFSSRVGDILLSINGEELTGKPISNVQEMINSVPRGNVQLIAKSSTLSEEAFRRQSNPLVDGIPADLIRKMSQEKLYAPPRPPESIFSDDSEFQTPAPPPPPIFDGKGLSGQTIDRLSVFSQGPQKGFRDDMSDVESLPAAPPPPVLPSHLLPLNRMLNKVEESYNSVGPPSLFAGDLDDDSDTDSMFTALPPPPPKLSPQSFTANPSRNIAHQVTGPLTLPQPQSPYVASSSDRGSNNDSESTLRGPGSMVSSGSDSSAVPPPARIRDPRLPVVEETFAVQENNAVESAFKVESGAEFKGTGFDLDGNYNHEMNQLENGHSRGSEIYDDDDYDDDKSSLYSIPAPPPKPILSDPDIESHDHQQTNHLKRIPSPSASLRSNRSISSALDFLDSTLLSHTDSFSGEIPMREPSDPTSSQHLSPPGRSTPAEGNTTPMSLAKSKSTPYGSYTDLSKDSATHMPIIMGEHLDSDKTTPRKKGFLNKLKKRFLSSNKTKLDDHVVKDSKGREIVHFTHDKVKSTSNRKSAMKTASSIPSIRDVFSEATDASMKRTISLDEQSMRMANEQDMSQMNESYDLKGLPSSVISASQDLQASGSMEHLSSSKQLSRPISRNIGLSLESGIDRLASPPRILCDSPDEAPAKGNRRRSLGGRRMSMESPPRSPAPPPPKNDDLYERIEEEAPHSRAGSQIGSQKGNQKLSKSVGDLSSRSNRSDSDVSLKGRKFFKRKNSDGNSSKKSEDAKKSSLKKKPPSPLLTRLKSIGKSSKNLPPESPSSSKKGADKLESDGSVSSSSTFSGFENIGGNSKESVARRKQSSKQSLMKFSFPPPPPGEESSGGDTSSDHSSKKAVEDSKRGGLHSPNAAGNKEAKRFSAVLEESESEPVIAAKQENIPPSPGSLKGARAPSFNDSEGWGSEFSDLESVRNIAPTRTDLVDPKLQAFSVPINQLPENFRFRAKTAPNLKRNENNGFPGRSPGRANGTASENDSDNESWGSEFSEFKNIKDLPAETNIPRSEDIVNPKLQPFNVTTNKRSSSLENLSKRGKHGNNEIQTENHNPIKMKSPLLNIFSKKDTKPGKKSKEKASKFSLFHSKKHVPRDTTPYLDTTTQEQEQSFTAAVKEESFTSAVKEEQVPCPRDKAVVEETDLYESISVVREAGVDKASDVSAPMDKPEGMSYQDRFPSLQNVGTKFYYLCL